jgi:hypothetical protein
MSRDGSGNYSLPSGQPVVSGSVISSSTFNALTSDLAAELTDSLSRSGKGAASTHLSMGNNRLTSLANGTARTDAANLGQVQDNAAAWLTSILGTANAIQASATPAIPAYAAGQVFNFVPASTNTGATTLQINGIAGPKDVFAFGAACVGGELVAGTPVSVVYDGTRFHVLGHQALPSRQGASLVLLNRTVASAASAVSWGSSIFTSSYDRWYVQVTNMSFSTTANYLKQFSTNNGATWVSTGNVYARYGSTAQTPTGSNVQNVSSANDTAMNWGLGYTTGYYISSEIFIDIVNQSMIRASQSWFSSGVQQGYTVGMGGISSVANAFRILPSTGTISGNFAIYGIKNS